jgi:hypothetical protein
MQQFTSIQYNLDQIAVDTDSLTGTHSIRSSNGPELQGQGTQKDKERSHQTAAVSTPIPRNHSRCRGSIEALEDPPLHML